MFKFQFLYNSLQNYPSCHAGTIVQLQSGGFLAAFYAGTHEGHEDVAIFLSRTKSLSESWSEPELIINTPGKSEGNPVLWVNSQGRISLFYVTQQRHGWDYVLMYDIFSEDEGHTWSAPRLFSADEGWMVKNKPIRLRSGRMVLPCYDEIHWDSFCLVSDDDGDTWRRTGLITGAVDNIQPTLLERADGSLIALLRSGPDRPKDRLIFQSVSTDAGETWSTIEPTELPNPNAGCDLVGLQSGAVALAFNDTPDSRTPLSIGYSTDECKTWPIRKPLENEPGEYSYPAIIQDREGLIHCLYTWNRTHMKHVIFDENWINE